MLRQYNFVFVLALLLHDILVEGERSYARDLPTAAPQRSLPV